LPQSSDVAADGCVQSPVPVAGSGLKTPASLGHAVASNLQPQLPRAPGGTIGTGGWWWNRVEKNAHTPLPGMTRGPFCARYEYGIWVPLAQKVGRRHAADGHVKPLVPLTGKSTASCGIATPLDGIWLLMKPIAGTPLNPLVVRPVLIPPKAFVLMYNAWALGTSPKNPPPKKSGRMLGWLVMVRVLHAPPMNMPANVSLRNCGESSEPKSLSEVATRLLPVQNVGPTLKSMRLKLTLTDKGTPFMLTLTVPV
jgi:hypothetical protein